MNTTAKKLSTIILILLFAAFQFQTVIPRPNESTRTEVKSQVEDELTRAEEKAAEHSGRVFFWKIETNRGRMYILGTIHVGREDTYPLRGEIESAFASSSEVLVEANIMESEQQLSALMTKYGVYQDGTSLKDHLPPDLFDKLTASLKASSFNYSQVQYMRPWLVSMLIQLSDPNSSGLSADFGVEKYFLSTTDPEQSILELEGAEFQISMIANTSEESQIEGLREVLDKMGESISATEIYDAWLQGDDNTIQKFTNLNSASKFNEVLIYKRNDLMVTKLDQFLKKGGTQFVMVGVAHTVGPRGIIAALKKLGYNVVRE